MPAGNYAIGKIEDEEKIRDTGDPDGVLFLTKPGNEWLEWEGDKIMIQVEFDEHKRADRIRARFISSRTPVPWLDRLRYMIGF